MKPFYIGLSFLSNHKPGAARLHAEAVEILEALDREHGPSLPLSRNIPACLRREPGGRPGFADDHADFNISHSRSMAAVAFSGVRSPRTGLPLRTGCDIQYAGFRRARRIIADAFFFPEERAYIDTGRGEPEKNLRFHHIWTLKESYLKLRGLSVFDMGKAPAFILTGNGEQYAPLSLTFYLYELGNPSSGPYILAAVREEDGDAPGIRWFSQETLPFISIAEIKAVVSPVTTVRPKI